MMPMMGFTHKITWSCDRPRTSAVASEAEIKNALNMNVIHSIQFRHFVRAS